MECPVCEAPMTHLGYFSWTCDDCGHRCEGDLPPGQIAAAEEEGAP
jgi:tRNA(Ile2) C34 agmatinyltransferase TiaS